MKALSTLIKFSGAFVGTIVHSGNTIASLGEKGVCSLGSVLCSCLHLYPNCNCLTLQQAEKQSELQDNLEQLHSETERVQENERSCNLRLMKLQSNIERLQSELAEMEEVDTSVVSPPKVTAPVSNDPVPVQKEPVTRASVESKNDPRPPCQSSAIEEATPISQLEVREAEFSSAVQKTTFLRAYEDITSSTNGIRYKAIQAMGQITHPLAARVLCEQYHCDEQLSVREQCVESLVALEMAECLPVLIHAQNDEAVSVRMMVVRGLYRLAQAQVKGARQALFCSFKDENPDIRRRAIICSGWLGGGEVSPRVHGMLNDDNVSVICAAAETLGTLGCMESIPSLLDILNSNQPEAGQSIHRALTALSGRRMVKVYPTTPDDIERLHARWRAWWMYDKS